MLTLWNIYMAVITVIAGFISAVKAEWLNKKVYSLITIVFLIFAIGNYSALEQVRSQREALYITIQSLQDCQSVAKIVYAARPPILFEFLFFHMIQDLIVIITIWIVPLFRLKD